MIWHSHPELSQTGPSVYTFHLIKATWDDCMCPVIERVGHNKSASGIHYFVPKRSVESLDYGVGSIRA